MIEDNDWDYPAPYTLDIDVLAEHIDGLGHTNNCEYLRWCEDIAWRHSEILGLGLAEYQNLGCGMAAVKTELEYCQASYQGQRLILGTWIKQCSGRLDLVRQYQIIRPEDKAVILRGSTRFVCIDLSSGKPLRMPEAFRQAYMTKPL
jgi:acyl-CoA thioester hydrolase